KHQVASMIDVVQLGTYDVSNYGDLLFPLVAREALKENPARLSYASPAGGTPLFPDSVRSIPVRDLLSRVRPYDVALIGGGNIIRLSPSNLDAYHGLPGM